MTCFVLQGHIYEFKFFAVTGINIYILYIYIIIFLSQIYISTLNILTQLENITFITKM